MPISHLPAQNRHAKFAFTPTLPFRLLAIRFSRLLRRQQFESLPAAALTAQETVERTEGLASSRGKKRTGFL